MKKPESVDFGLLLGASTNTEDAPNKRATGVSPRKLRNVKRETSPLDEPSTSFKIKKEPSSVSKIKEESVDIQMIKKEPEDSSEGFYKKRKTDDEGSVIKEELERKKLKVMKREIKQERKGPASMGIKEEESETESSKRKLRDRCNDDPGDVDTDKCLDSSKDFDSEDDVEDDVSNNASKCFQFCVNFLFISRLS